MQNQNKHDFYVIIPARMHSTRLPNKMMLDIGGVPLVIKTAQQAKQSNAVKVIVATDHPDIEKACALYGIEAISTSDENQTGTDRVAEAVNLLKLKPDTIIINVQGDEPLIDPALINNLANFMHNRNADIATVAHSITEISEITNPNIVKVVLDKDSNALYFSRATIPFCRDNMTLNAGFLRHIGIYAYTANFLNNYINMPSAIIENIEKLEQLRILYNGHKIAVFVTENAPTIGVDTAEDLQRIRHLINK